MLNLKSLMFVTLLAVPVAMVGAMAQESGGGGRNGGYVNGVPVHPQTAPAATVTSGMSSAGRGLSGPAVTTDSTTGATVPSTMGMTPTPGNPGGGRVGAGDGGSGNGQ